MKNTSGYTNRRKYFMLLASQKYKHPQFSPLKALKGIITKSKQKNTSYFS